MYETEFSVELNGDRFDVTAWAYLLDWEEGTQMEDFDFTVIDSEEKDVTAYAKETDELHDMINSEGTERLLTVYHEFM